MTDSMIEKAKAAAYQAALSTNDVTMCARDDDMAYLGGSALDLKLVVRAILSSIRDPNEAMLKAAGDAVYANGGPLTAAANRQGCAAYSAAIDAILKEGT